MNKGIPNLNTISTYIERLVIESVKRSQFKYKLETQELTENQSGELEYKVEFQRIIVEDIKNRLLVALEDIFKHSSYIYYKEKRSLI